uniref:Similarity n=1 Tax=Microcystis aeruginosa (strain PCC 7806) TaxID=267872 RepID=A8YBJ1_MICA7|nr:unnamed protein product [Microcystis aeruginosa PCC 7806]
MLISEDSRLIKIKFCRSLLSRFSAT